MLHAKLCAGPVRTSTRFVSNSMNITSKNSASPSTTLAPAAEAVPPDVAAHTAGLHQHAVPHGAPPGLQGRRLQDLSDEPLRRVTSFLPGADRLALAHTNKPIHKELGPMLNRMQVSSTARAVSSLATFLAALGGAGAPVSSPAATVRDLPATQRSDSLSALAGRIHLFAPDNARAALAQFRGAVAEISENDRSPELVKLDRIASFGIGIAGRRRAAYAGENIQQIARFHGITDIGVIRRSEQRTIASRNPASAGSAARAGGNVLAIAAEHGVTAYCIALLE